VRELSDQIETALREVMLHAEQEEALSLIGRAEQIFLAAEVGEHDEEQRLERSLELRRGSWKAMRSFAVILPGESTLLKRALLGLNMK